MQELTKHTLVGTSGHEIDIQLTTAGHLTPRGVIVTGIRCYPLCELFRSGEHEVRHRRTQAHHRSADTQYDVVTSSALGVTADISVSAGNGELCGIMAPSPEREQPDDALSAANNTQYDSVTSSALQAQPNDTLSAADGA